MARSRTAWVIILLITALGLVVRLGGPGSGGFGRDEAQVVQIATLPRAWDVVSFLARHESHPPLYYFLVRWALVPFNGNPGAVIGLSLAAGLLTIGAAGFCAAAMGGRRAGVAAALFVAVVPMLADNSTMVRPYALLGLLLLLATWSLWRAMERPSPISLATFTVCCAFLVYTHNWAVVPVAVLYMTGVALAGGRVVSGTGIRGLLGSLLLLALVYAPWLPVTIRQAAVAGYGGIPYPRVPDLLIMCLAWGFGLNPNLLAAAATGAVLLAAFGQRSIKPEVDAKRRRTLMLFVGCPAFVVALAASASPATNLLVPWTFTILTPTVLVGLAVWLGQKWEKGGRLALTVTGVWLALLTWTASGLLNTPRSNTRRTAEEIGSLARAEDLVVVAPAYWFPSFAFYYRGPSLMVSYPEEDGPPLAFDSRKERDEPQAAWQKLARRVEQVVARDGRIWLVTPTAGDISTRDRLVAALELGIGPPRCRSTPPPVAPRFESVEWRVFGPEGTVGMCGEGR